MTIEHPIEDEVKQLARRVEKARGRLAYQFDPALTEALSEDELHAERDLAEKIRGQERDQRWKHVQAAAAASDRARHTTEAIEKADIRDLLVARKAIAAQRRESSPHAKLASLYRHRAWSLRALAAVVGAGMLWSAVNVQQNIAPGGPGDPLYWFSYLIESMISVCLIIIMVGTNKVAEWGILESRRQVAFAEIALLAVTVSLNTYPYLRDGSWYDAAVHAVAPVMIGVALLIHDAASARYGHAIAQATEQVRDLPDPADLIRRSFPTVASFRGAPKPEFMKVGTPPAALESASGAEQKPLDAETHVTPTIEPVVEKPVSAFAVRVNHSEVSPKREERSTPSVAVVKAFDHSATSSTSSTRREDLSIADALASVAAKAEEASKTDAELDTSVTAAKAKAGAPASNGSSKATTRSAGAAKAEKTSAPVDVETSSAPSVVSDTKTVSAVTKAAKESPVVSSEPDIDSVEVVRAGEIYDTGQFRVAEILEQELAELQAERRRARTSRPR
ncbi:hypothetical protein [Nocardia australiensis]|uniref:hypothetical protein n=1 Tax=Nocardia australiensis TaxID=2887191 RepID=UPI001D13A4FB|nr:hypothetical protein [Nocardia australiensis]